MEAWIGFEPMHSGFADRRVNQLRHHARTFMLQQWRVSWERHSRQGAVRERQKIRHRILTVVIPWKEDRLDRFRLSDGTLLQLNGYSRLPMTEARR